MVVFRGHLVLYYLDLLKANIFQNALKIYNNALYTAYRVRYLRNINATVKTKMIYSDAVS